VGEILLVMIGILLALQVNNINTNSKNRLIEAHLLEGIKTDLAIDTAQIKNRFLRSFNDLKSSISKFDSVIELDDTDINIHYLDSIFERCTRQRNTFWPVTGTYQSVINNGSSDLITNKSLFKSIQRHYEHIYKINTASGARMDDLSVQIRYKVKDYRILSINNRMEVYRNKATRNEIEFWFYQLSQFHGNVLYAQDATEQLIEAIDEEIKNSS
jgi:hypothetical protein